MNFAHRTIKNAVFNSMSWALPLCLQFLFLPYIVDKLGTDAYGILALVWTLIGYFAILDLGLENAVIKYVAEYNAEKDPNKINEVICVTFFIFLILGFAGGLTIFLISKMLVTRFFKIPSELIQVTYLAFCLASAGFFFTILISLFSAIPNGLSRYDITATVTMLMGAGTILGTVILLYFRFGLISIVVLNISVSLLVFIAYVVIAKLLLPSLSFRPVFIFLVFKKIIRFGFFSLLSRLSYLINFQADRLVAAAILGVSWVTYYVVPFTLVNRITAITFRIGVVIFPAISELQGSNRYDKLPELYLVSSRVIATIATAICLPLFFFGSRLLSLWMGPDFGEKASLVILLITLALYISALTNVPTYVVDGLGRPNISGLASMFNACLNLAFVVPLAMSMGINGIATAFFIGNVCVAPVFIWYVNNKIIGISLLRLIKEAYAKPFLAALIMILPMISIPQYRIGTLPLLLVVVMLSSLSYLIIASVIGVFPKHEISVMLDYFRAALKKMHKVANRRF